LAKLCIAIYLAQHKIYVTELTILNWEYWKQENCSFDCVDRT